MLLESDDNITLIDIVGAWARATARRDYKEMELRKQRKKDQDPQGELPLDDDEEI